MNGKNLKYFVMGATIVAAGLGALAVDIPNSFASGTVISSSALNANFAALKAAVDALEAANSVTTARLQDNAVTGAKIAANAVIGAKIANGAVDATKTADEPGVGQEIEPATAFSIANSDVVVVNAEITVPGSGFVLAVVSGTLSINHTLNTGSQVFIDITKNTQNPAATDARSSTVLPPSLPTGTYETPYSVQKIFRVNAAGVTSISVRAVRQFGSGGTATGRLSLMYFPTNYGLVE